MSDATTPVILSAVRTPIGKYLGSFADLSARLGTAIHSGLFEVTRERDRPLYQNAYAATILTVAESPREKGVIWVGTDDGNVQVTRNDGGSWSKINANIPKFPKEAWVGKIDASHHVDGRAYVIVDQHRLDDFTPHAWRCDNYGASCVDIAAGLRQRHGELARFRGDQCLARTGGERDGERACAADGAAVRQERRRGRALRPACG